MSLDGKRFYGPDNLDFPASGGLLLIRHSARHPIRQIPESYTAGLTEAGRDMATDFGKKLAQKWILGEVVASPVCRCMETCEYILRGAINGAYPRPAVRSLNALHFDQKLTGLPGLSQVFLNDAGFVTLISAPQTPAYTFLHQNLLAELPFPGEVGVLNVAVTHDVIVTFLQASLLSLPTASIHDYPGYLEGIFLVRDGARVKLA